MKNHITQFCLSVLCAWTMGSIIACMPPISDPLVMHVASSDGIAYAALEPGKVPYPLAAPYAQSEDGGKTWSPAKSVPQGIFQKPQPSVLCDPNRASLCFRIPQKSQVDESNDGGKTWRVGWQIPPGREDFMLSKYCQKYTCSRTGDWGPYDLAFLNQNGVNTLLVAMGEEGVLVRTADGDWQRYGVLGATPSPMQASNLLIAIARMFLETLILFALSFVAVSMVMLVAQRKKDMLTEWFVFVVALIFPICWLSLLLWAFGFIPRYGSALLIALILTATVALYAAWFSTRQRPAE
jgi:hypothetical protein